MRKSVEITIQDRENSWKFRIREMPATKLESWIVRAGLLLAGSGVSLSADLKEAGAVLAESGLAALGRLDYEKAKPLLDELLGCCSRVLDNVEERCSPESADNYIEDVATLFKLRREAIKVNLGFLSGGLGSLFTSQEKSDTEPNSKTSAGPSAPTSPPFSGR